MNVKAKLSASPHLKIFAKYCNVSPAIPKIRSTLNTVYLDNVMFLYRITYPSSKTPSYWK